MLPQAPNPDDPREARPPQNKKNEIVRLQREITDEVTGDAPHIARMVFGDTKDHPDIVGLPNQQVDNVYRQKFIAQDREWLQAEARRDPEQFLKVADRIGVTMPEPGPVAPQDLHPAMQPGIGAPAPPAMPAAPSPVPMPPPPPAVAPPQLPPIPATPAPVILGPTGQPLPPSGGVGV